MERSQAIEEAAKCLLIDAFWSDDRMRRYQADFGTSIIRDHGQQMEEWPLPVIPVEVLAGTLAMIERIEAKWGRSFDVVAEEMGIGLDALMYRTTFACIGHGIGPDDDGGFPDDLDPSPIHADNPADNHVPEIGEWTCIFPCVEA